jgi:hypothetical protein
VYEEEFGEKEKKHKRPKKEGKEGGGGGHRKDDGRPQARKSKR